MLVSLKGALENIGGMGVPLILLSQHRAYSLHWHVLSALVSGLVVQTFTEFYLIIFLVLNRSLDLNILTQLKHI